LLANFFVKAKTKKLVVNLLLILSFNLIILDFIKSKKLLKATTTIFLKNFFVLTNLFIAIATKKNQKN